jgi:uncharacterized protein YqgV (UPF0045/DUF77 family)
VVRVEFTIEPFVEGEPGDHVTSAIGALEERFGAVDVGPFGSSIEVQDASVGWLLATLAQTAVDHGATHVAVNLERLG